MLVLLAVQLAGAFLDLVKGTAREDAVFVVTVRFVLKIMKLEPFLIILIMAVFC